MAMEWMTLTYVLAAQAAVGILLSLPTPKFLKNLVLYFGLAEEDIPLQWLILTYVVVAEAAVAIWLTLPTPKLLRNRLAYLVSLILHRPLCRNEHRLMCTSEVCTAAERDRYDKYIYKTQRNVILCIASVFLYWSIWRICMYQKDMESVEEVKTRYKSQ